ncbi:hypothetical protein PO883_34110 [Massilia sp. DJPM01]|uniref:hypothetical protein n=1 Tax=Massilia sp. DJPM01 TaxID=3024404 RepID=UPI00259DDA74|nr:hypothetical protein [Massilia sp. DJPM01]MDM5182205.1 hypothetical protein [Massilia sp. DJPM01]
MSDQSSTPMPPISLSIPVVVRRHATETATRWWRRDSAYLDHPRTTFATLAQYDESIDAHLDGLLVAGNGGLDALQKALENDAADLSADIFAALAFAFLSEDEATITSMLARTDALAGKAWALDGLFAWHDSPLIVTALTAHLNEPNPRYRDAALAQCHTHRLSGGDHLSAILTGSGPELVSRALRTAGECGRVDLLAEVRAWLDPARRSDPAIRFWGAWSATMLNGLDEESFSVLQSFVEQGDSHQPLALKLICLSLPHAGVVEYLEKLSPLPLTPELRIKAVGWSGHVGYGNWLIEQMRVPALAATAAEAFRMITGFDCERSDTVLASPLGEEQFDAAIKDGYAYPDADQVAAWWQENQSHYRDDARIFLGRPVSFAWLAEILDHGEQAHRELAALHWPLLKPGSMLLPTRAHSAIQWLRLQQLKGSTL